MMATTTGQAEAGFEMGRAGATFYVKGGHGLAVVLVHGVGMRHEVWAPQLRDLSRDFTVIAYDTLGHGRSAVPDEGVALADYADQLRDLLDHLGIERAAIVGHSMGALIATEHALRYPTRTRGLAALNAVFCRTPEQSAAVRARAAVLTTLGVEATLAETIKRWFGDPVPPGLRQTAGDVAGYLSGVEPDGYSRAYRLFSVSDRAHEERLPKLAVPALVMTGENDANSSPAMSRAMAACVREGQVEIVRGAGHMMTLTHEAEVGAALRAFLATLGP